VPSLRELSDEGILVFNDGYRTRQSELGRPGFPILRVAEVGTGRIESGETDTVHESLRRRIGLKLAEEGDIVLTTKGTVGRVARIDSAHVKYVYSPQVCFFRIKNSDVIDPDYFYYWLSSPEFRRQLDSFKAQTDMADYVNLRDLSFAKFEGLEATLQRAAARVLRLFDDKIELNRRMSETLGVITRTIFRSWFVDFDPVRAKIEGRQPYGMSAETAALFPNSFIESELGPIPADWPLGSVASIASYVNGRNFTREASGSGRMVIRIAELNSGPGGSTVFNEVDAAPRNVAYPDDILFAWSGSLGVYRWHRGESLVNQHIFKVVCEEFPPWFVYYHLLEALSFFREIASHKATTMGHIQRHHLSESLLATPPFLLLEAAGCVIEPLYKKTHFLELESQTLGRLRDILLPKLISGEILIKDAERLLEATL
jgi:type I restriction enzyme S subunit